MNKQQNQPQTADMPTKTDYKAELIHKYSTQGKWEHWLFRQGRKGKKRFAQRGSMAGLIAGLIAGALIVAHLVRHDTRQIEIDGHIITATVADTPQERAHGLQGVKHLPDNQGMLFVWDDSDTRTFWMAQTPMPLDVAFIDEFGQIVDIQSMAPLTTEHHISKYPARYALEVRRGWFADRGILPGEKIIVIGEGGQ